MEINESLALAVMTAAMAVIIAYVVYLFRIAREIWTDWLSERRKRKYPFIVERRHDVGRDSTSPDQ